MKYIFRNKDFIKTFFLISILSAICLILLFFISKKAFLVAFVFLSIILIVYTLSTLKRYNQINELSSYLVSLCNGQYNLSINENEEGELSILKNNIYKTALKLNSQAELLFQDKLYLADALADISHQIKTPVASMMIMSDLLQNDNLSYEKRKEFICNIDHQLEKINWIIQNLLKLSKLDANRIVLKQEKVNVKKLVESVVENMLIQMEVHSQTLEINADETAKFIGDFNWSVEALTNIVKNCLEHTPDGGKLIITYNQTPLYTKLVVEDNGVGIQKEDIPHIFERFYKGKNLSKDSVGIGLALTKSVLNRENATIAVESEINIGTKFTIKFFNR